MSNKEQKPKSCKTTDINCFIHVWLNNLIKKQMELKDFKQHISNFPKGTVFNYGISNPFSWRGSYDEVAFSIVESQMTREEILSNIELAYTKTFYGYKGGEYEYDDYTTVNFEEEGSRNYSDGRYTAQMIAKIENKEEYRSQEERLVKLAFV